MTGDPILDVCIVSLAALAVGMVAVMWKWCR